MAEETTQQMTPPPEKKRGWCCMGCLIIVLVLAIGTIGMAVYAYHIVKTRATAASPIDIPELQITEAQREEAAKKLDTVDQAMRNNLQETVTLSPVDLNAIIMRQRQVDGETGQLQVDIVDDKISMDFSLPLKRVPGLSGRYINGHMVATVAITNGVLEVYPQEVELNGERLPAWLMDSLREKNVVNWVYDNPNARETLKKIGTLKLQDGKMIIGTRGE